MEYYTHHLVKPKLPDDRLVWVHLRGHVMDFDYREGFAHPELVRDLDEFSRHIARSKVWELSETPPCKAEWTANFDSAPDSEMALWTASFRVRWSCGTPHIEILYRRGLMAPELAGELNEYVMPEVCRLLVPIKKPKRA